MANTHPCAESVDGATAIPALPAARRVPPLMSKVPFTSIAPFPALVGPQIVNEPPDMVADPLESKPSPSASTDIMISLGATTAYNIDGGGSSTMYFDGALVNNPLGKNQERGTSDILYIAGSAP